MRFRKSTCGPTGSDTTLILGSNTTGLTSIWHGSIDPNKYVFGDTRLNPKSIDIIWHPHKWNMPGFLCCQTAEKICFKKHSDRAASYGGYTTKCIHNSRKNMFVFLFFLHSDRAASYGGYTTKCIHPSIVMNYEYTWWCTRHMRPRDQYVS